MLVILYTGALYICLFVIKEADLSEFDAEPTIGQLNHCQKSDLLSIVDCYEIVAGKAVCLISTNIRVIFFSGKTKINIAQTSDE